MKFNFAMKKPEQDLQTRSWHVPTQTQVFAVHNKLHKMLRTEERHKSTQKKTDIQSWPRILMGFSTNSSIRPGHNTRRCPTNSSIRPGHNTTSHKFLEREGNKKKGKKLKVLPFQAPWIIQQHVSPFLHKTSY